MTSFADFFEKVQRSPFYGERLQGFLSFVDPKPNMRVLDVGCGPGALTIELAKRTREAVGVDRDREMEAHARRNARAAGVDNVEFRVAGAQKLPFEAETFDLVTATSVLYLLSRPEEGLCEMSRVLRAGGTAADLDPSVQMTHQRIDVFARKGKLSEFEWDALHGWLSAAQSNHQFSVDSLRWLYQGCGLQVLEIAEHMGGMVLFCKGIKLNASKKAEV
jgi:ubiquinone/menaquinone biosynthesis C-methylase UbiE